MKAEEMDTLLTKIWTKLFNVSVHHLNANFDKLLASGHDLERKNSNRHHQLSDYFCFADSMGILRGIVKTAAADDLQIQIVAEFY